MTQFKLYWNLVIAVLFDYFCAPLFSQSRKNAMPSNLVCKGRTRADYTYMCVCVSLCSVGHDRSPWKLILNGYLAPEQVKIQDQSDLTDQSAMRKRPVWWRETKLLCRVDQRCPEKAQLVEGKPQKVSYSIPMWLICSYMFLLMYGVVFEIHSVMMSLTSFVHTKKNEHICLVSIWLVF